MTNQGDIVNKILRGSNDHEKEYKVRVNQPITREFLEQMRNGVEILDTVTKPCFVEKTGGYTFRIILTQGLNRQIRRMCQALGYRVVALKRVRIMNIELGDLRSGSYREVTEAEWKELERLLEDSSNEPVSRQKMERKKVPHKKTENREKRIYRTEIRHYEQPEKACETERRT